MLSGGAVGRWPFWVAAALGIATALVLGVGVAWLAFDILPVSGNVQLLVVSIGVSFVLRHVVLLLFGAAKLPGLAKSVGQSTRILKSELKTDAAAPAASDTAAEPPAHAHAGSPAPGPDRGAA